MSESRNSEQMKQLKVALVCDWLTVYSGAERVIEEIIHLFPNADLFALVDFLPSHQRAFIQNRPVTTSFIQRLPWARKKYRTYLPFMPIAVEQFDVSGYDLVISSSHAVAKGVITGPDQLHISYVHSPMRYAWDLTHQYLSESNLERGPRSWLARSILHYMRMWDYRTAPGVDAFVGNSAFIARRIKKVYSRDATVIHPPVNTENFTPVAQKDDFYLTASRLVPYKKVPVIVQAFARMPERKLVVIGDGPEMAKVRAVAAPNVQIMGYQPDEVLKDHLQRARAFLFAAEEDFGIVPVEAQACGTPVIGYGRGGLTETVIPERTGVFFDEQTPESIIEAVRKFDTLKLLSPQEISSHAAQFSAARFRQSFGSFVISELGRTR